MKIDTAFPWGFYITGLAVIVILITVAFLKC